PSLPTTSISEIRSLSPDHYVNNKYRILIRVVDFLPAKLEDFATYGTPPDEPDSDEEYDTNEMYGKKKKIWMWRFAFLVEDKAGDRMMVIVSGKEAECLLKFEATE